MSFRITRFGIAVLLLCLAAAGARADDWPGPQPAIDSHASSVVLEALALLGVPYKYGGDDPARGLDCSGLVRHVFRSVGLELPRNAESIARFGAEVKRHALEVGDLVFFNTRGRRYSHVGIYIGDNRFVHAPARRGHVRVEDMGVRYWQSRFNGARRLAVSLQAAADIQAGIPPDPRAATWAQPDAGAPAQSLPVCASCEP